MTEPQPADPRRDDALAEFDLPLIQRLALQLQVTVLSVLLRASDVLLVALRPRLLRPYLGIWWEGILRTPYRARRSFEVVRALQASGQRFRELVYGETPLVTALSVLKHAGVGPASRLVDLGAGRGRVLIAASWLGARAHGVELLAEHVNRVAPRLQAAGMTLEEGDMMRADLRDATHVFTNWVALGDETKARLVAHLRGCRPGTRIVTVTRAIEAEDFPCRSRRWALFSWGLEAVWVHEYRPKDSPELA
ncbi:class I SAM-dependent methyltransferase [Corallococcus sp. H22C18031201]|uniref:class I SAM-dependent methyltransferase n=1 Tax=Citreicoccus inhibens TaxID=2849499 RepID=UPI000E74A527|nr:class I SAM-dependent methyltransferase [Citreicoccus inhibens]MBU8898803.1 class I SAM-dependent methyltransferase [Citreicoccus inhibens]RJS24170.1 class I SAM-dependent methyltransferase [Corallococcus sp. H22C18031201]